MSLYGVLRTGVSGMNAQSTKLGTVADNVANSGTVGYKRASTEFSSLLLQSGSGEYNSGAVNSSIRYAVSAQGALSYTTSSTDMAVWGDGFFVVSDPSGRNYLTRAGAFSVDGGTGELKNSAGFTLMGYDIRNGDPNVVLNGTAGMVPVQVGGLTLTATPSKTGTLSVNLPSSADVVAGDTPADNLATSTFTDKSSLVAYDNIGNQVTLDVYYTKTAGGPPAQWEMTIFNKADANATTGGLPYASGPLATKTLTFDAKGAMTSVPPNIAVNVPNGETLTLDLTGTTQLAKDYTPITGKVDGNAPSAIKDVVIDDDGTLYGLDENGQRQALYRIPLADVPSPDKLNPLAGNVFETTTESGDLQVGFPGEGGLGSLNAGALEQSNVDMATELTEMIVAQRDYTANSKVFQTGTELLDVLMNLKR